MRAENVQLLAGMFLSNTNQGQVNYEKILSFISAAMKEKYVLGKNLELCLNSDNFIHFNWIEKFVTAMILSKMSHHQKMLQHLENITYHKTL